jgi:hypothetical protein
MTSSTTELREHDAAGVGVSRHRAVAMLDISTHAIVVILPIRATPMRGHWAVFRIGRLCSRNPMLVLLSMHPAVTTPLPAQQQPGHYDRGLQ